MSDRRTRALKPKSKVWLELSGEPVFGDGKARMLRCIRDCGTLSEAARRLGMSYRGLWGRLSEMERRLGTRLVQRRVGGSGGGGSQLTPAGRKLLDRYDRFREGINSFIDARFARIFKR